MVALYKSELQKCMQGIGRWVWILVVVMVFLGVWGHKEVCVWCREMPLLRVWSGSLVANAGAILFAGGIALGGGGQGHHIRDEKERCEEREEQKMEKIRKQFRIKS